MREAAHCLHFASTAYARWQLHDIEREMSIPLVEFIPWNWEICTMG